MMNKVTRGGQRPGAGRKPLKIKKLPLTTYISENDIALVGGKQEAKAIAERAIARRAKQCA